MTTTTDTARAGRHQSAGAAAPPLPRGRRTVAAVIVAVLLLLVAGFAAWQAVLVQLGRQPYPFDAAAVSGRLNQTPWSDVIVVIVGAVFAVLGGWLLLLAITPANRKMVQLAEPESDVSTGIRPADLRRAVNGAAERIDGISGARTVLRRGTAAVSVTSPLGNPAGLADKVTGAVTEQLTELNPVHPLTPRVTLTGKDH